MPQDWESLSSGSWVLQGRLWVRGSTANWGVVSTMPNVDVKDTTWNSFCHRTRMNVSPKRRRTELTFEYRDQTCRRISVEIEWCCWFWRQDLWAKRETMLGEFLGDSTPSTVLFLASYFEFFETWVEAHFHFPSWIILRLLKIRPHPLSTRVCEGTWEPWTATGRSFGTWQPHHFDVLAY